MSEPETDRRRPPRCSFCGKSQEQVGELIPAADGGARICDGCVTKAHATFEEARPRIHPKVRPTRQANIDGLRLMLEVVEALRAPDGCPWDREQTHMSLRPYLLEETYEALEAIEAGSPDDLGEELGDLLLQVFMHHAIAQETGGHDIAEITRHASEKMINRHPHVFGDVTVTGSDEVLTNWEGLKRQEERKRGRVSALEGAPQSLPALAWALSLQKRAARVGFDAAEPGTAESLLADVAAETDPARRADRFGDLLFTMVDAARRMKINPEDALRASARRYRRRFERMESAALARGEDVRNMDADALRTLWAAVAEE